MNKENFTQEQKEAIIYSLYQIARSDEDLADDEVAFIKVVGDFLGEVFDYMSINSFISKSALVYMKTLNELTECQKEWYVVAVYSLINSDQKLFDEEFSVSNGFLNGMGITTARANAIISKIEGGLDYY